MIGTQAEVTYLDYSDVPLINQDIEFPEPEAVGRLRATVKEADAIWVFTPEYNFSYPGHVKNLFDWLSRPLVAGDYETPTVINGKKIALTGAGGKMATAKCREKLTELLTLLKVFFLLREVTDDRGHSGHRLAQVVAGSLDGFALHLQFCDNCSLTVSDGPNLFQTDMPEVDGHQ